MRTAGDLNDSEFGVSCVNKNLFRAWLMEDMSDRLVSGTSQKRAGKNAITKQKREACWLEMMRCAGLSMSSEIIA